MRVVTAGLSTCLFLLFIVVSSPILSQSAADISRAITAILQMPDSKAKLDSIIAFTGKTRKNLAIDTLFKEGFALMKRLNYHEAEARLQDSYGVFNRDFSRYGLALENHKRSASLAKNNGDITTEIHALNNIGVVYRRLDENGKALTFHIDAMKLAEQTGDHYSASVSLNSIGNIHIVLRNYNDAIGYFKRSLTMAEKAKNYLGMAMNYNNIGEAYEFMGKLDSADKYYKESLFYNEKISSSKGIAICYNSMGTVYRKQGKYDAALKLYRDAKAITDTLGDELYRANTYNNLGNVYLLLNNYDSSRKMFKNAIGIARTIGTMSEMRTAYEGLMNLNERRGYLDSALFYSRLFKEINDSIVFESNNRHVRQMEALYTSEKEKAEFAVIQNNHRNERIFLLGALILFLLVLTSGILYYLRYRLLERNKRLQQELNIRSQIATDLHDDMGSTLSSIYIFSELLKKPGNDKEALLNKIEANARDTLDALDDIIWLVKPSNDKFGNLCQHIQEYAVPMFESKGIRFTIDFPESIAEIPLRMDVRRNIFLIIKECVNNLVKYAQCTHASITAKDNEDVIAFSIKDNGVGFDPEKLTNRNGVKNIKARAGSMNAPITITTAPGAGVLVEFEVDKSRSIVSEK